MNKGDDNKLYNIYKIYNQGLHKITVYSVFIVKVLSRFLSKNIYSQNYNRTKKIKNLN